MKGVSASLPFLPNDEQIEGLSLPAPTSKVSATNQATNQSIAKDEAEPEPEVPLAPAPPPPAAQVPPATEQEGMKSTPSSGNKESEAQQAALVPQQLGLVGPVVQKLENCLILDGGQVTSFKKVEFIEALEAVAAVLDKALGGGMGSYMVVNIEKLRKSKAPSTKDCYRTWLLSELPIHKATGYKSYVDESAFMANLWIGWQLEFFAELFRLLHQGDDVKTCVNNAYAKTLKTHHNMFQSGAFYAAARQLPSKEKFFETLQGSEPNKATVAEVKEAVGAFAKSTKTISDFCGRMVKEIETKMAEEKKKK